MSQSAETASKLEIAGVAQNTSAGSSKGGGKQNAADLVRVVVQRCNSAELLIDNVDTWVSIGQGMVVSVSFGQGCNASVLPRVVKALLQMPLLTRGVWGDGDSPRSVVDMCRELDSTNTAATLQSVQNQPKPPSIMIIPTASLTSKAKQGGKLLSYWYVGQLHFCFNAHPGLTCMFFVSLSSTLHVTIIIEVHKYYAFAE